MYREPKKTYRQNFFSHALLTFRLPVSLGVGNSEVLLHLLEELYAQTPHPVGVGHAEEARLLRLLLVALPQFFLQSKRSVHEKAQGRLLA